MNKVTLIGRLTKDPELKFIPGSGTAVTSITLAVDNYNSKTNEKGADFIPVVIWGKSAENVAQYCQKGRQIAISGRISIRSYDAKDGTKRYATEVVADAFNGVEFVGSNGNGNGGSNGGNKNNNNNNSYGGANFEDMTPIDDGDMPF